MFKVPGDDHDRSAGKGDLESDDRSASAPLLPGNGRRESEGSRIELEELERAEGLQDASKGTLMDGIANVSCIIGMSLRTMLTI